VTITTTRISSSECLDFGRRFLSLKTINLFGRMDVARVMSLIAFSKSPARFVPDGGKVAVVSGSDGEPELSLLEGRYSVEFLNYEDNPELCDLTLDWSGHEWDAHRAAYDLVLCEQVLEHLIDPSQATKNLAQLLRRLRPWEWCNFPVFERRIVDVRSHRGMVSE
jgi:hypothetical protein